MRDYKGVVSALENHGRKIMVDWVLEHGVGRGEGLLDELLQDICHNDK